MVSFYKTPCRMLSPKTTACALLHVFGVLSNAGDSVFNETIAENRKLFSEIAWILLSAGHSKPNY
jgi:hypothetical protein